ncbi:MAG: hypothetical protein AAFQ82_27100, partial [Myxococcota bacterium]
LDDDPTVRADDDRGALIGRVTELNVRNPGNADQSPAPRKRPRPQLEATSLDLMRTDVDLDPEAVAKARAQSEARSNRYRLCEQAVYQWRRGRGEDARRTIARVMSDEPGPLAYLIDLIAETDNDDLVDVLEEIYVFASEPWVKAHARQTAKRLRGSSK